MQNLKFKPVAIRKKTRKQPKPESVQPVSTDRKYITVEKGIKFNTQTEKYMITLDLGKNRAGERVRKFETFDNLAKARKRLRQFRAQKELKQAPPPLEKITLGEYADKFLVKHGEQIEATTVEYYRKIVKRLKSAPISAKRLGEVQKSDILGYIQDLKENTTIKPQTINKDIIFLRLLFDNAIKDEYTTKNPAKLVDTLRVADKFKADFYTIEEVKQILTLLETYPERNVKIIYYLAMCLGLRRGEISGLKWESINFEKQTLKVENNRVPVAGEIVEKAPKSKSSIRKLSLSQYPFILEALKECKAWQEKQFSGCEYVIVNKTKGEALNPRVLDARLKIFREKYGIRKIRLHDLRHTFASIAFDQGASPSEVSTALGHCDTRITEHIYIHILAPTVNNGAANAFSKIFDDDEKPNE